MAITPMTFGQFEDVANQYDECNVNKLITLINNKLKEASTNFLEYPLTIIIDTRDKNIKQNEVAETIRRFIKDGNWADVRTKSIWNSNTGLSCSLVFYSDNTHKLLR